MRKAIRIKKNLGKTRKITCYRQFKTKIETSMFINYLDHVRELRKSGNVKVTVVPVGIRHCEKTVGCEN